MPTHDDRGYQQSKGAEKDRSGADLTMPEQIVEQYPTEQPAEQ